MNIDCTLSKLVIPGFPEMSPEFGTKKVDDASGSAREAAQNAMLPFERHRPIPVIENSNTSDIQDHVSFIIQKSGISLTLGHAAFYGCHVNVFNSSDGEVQVIYAPQKTKVILPGKFAEFKNLSSGWLVLTEFDRLIFSEAQARESADNAINAKIPNQANAENQLADKDFVNSSITATAARALTYDAAGGPFPTKADLDNASDFYYQNQFIIEFGNERGPLL